MDLNELVTYQIKAIKTPTAYAIFGKQYPVEDEGYLLRVNDYVIVKAGVASVTCKDNVVTVQMRDGKWMELEIG